MANLNELFSVLCSPAQADRARSGLEKHYAEGHCGTARRRDRVSEPGMLGGELYTLHSFPVQPLPNRLCPQPDGHDHFSWMSGQTLAVTHFQAPASFGSELGNKRPIQSQAKKRFGTSEVPFFAGNLQKCDLKIVWNAFKTGTARTSQRWQASGVRINTGSIIRSKASPEGPLAPRRAG